jgi:hypothetical protein
MNWKNLVETNYAKTLILPAGWDDTETIALQMGCSPDRVREHMAPLVRAHVAEMKAFTVWDRETKAKRRVTAYHPVTALPEAPKRSHQKKVA